MENWQLRLKKRIRAWLDVEALDDATVRRRHLHGRVDMISQHTAELLGMIQRQTQVCDSAHRFCTMTTIAWEMQRDNIEAGHLPCGCFSEHEHRNGGGRGHTESLMRRVDRWLEYKKREESKP